MNKKIKQQFFKIFYIAAFLFITIFFILPYLIQISTYFHETSHVKALEKYGIESSYNFNLLETIPNFFNPQVTKLGVTKFDFETYEKLDAYDKARINMAGIISDLRFLFLIGVFLSMTNVYVFYKVRIRRNYNLNKVLAVNWILFMWLLALIQITVSNITFSSGDFWQLVRNIIV